MATAPYLAMTASDFAENGTLPERTGWLLAPAAPLLPPATGPGCLLILTDQEPLPDGDAFLSRLLHAVEKWQPAGVVLDFQREASASAALVRKLVSALPCPVAPSDRYAGGLSCPVFLSPCPHHVHLADHIALWPGREIWLDLALDAETITVTKEGPSIHPLPIMEAPETGHRDPALHCRYAMETGADFARFTLWRTREDLEALAREAEALGIQTLIGLWSEWQDEK